MISKYGLGGGLTVEDLKIRFFTSHVHGCIDLEPYPVFRDGGLVVGKEIFREQDLHPIVTRPVAWERSLGDILNYLEEKNWTAHLDEEEGLVKVEGLNTDRYSIDETGAIYGEGPLRHLLLDTLQGMGPMDG